MSDLNRMQCEQVFKKLDDYIDAELSAIEMERIRQHLEICAWCASTYEFETSLLKEVETRLQKIPVPDTLRGRVADALRKARAER